MCENEINVRYVAPIVFILRHKFRLAHITTLVATRGVGRLKHNEALIETIINNIRMVIDGRR